MPVTVKQCLLLLVTEQFPLSPDDSDRFMLIIMQESFWSACFKMSFAVIRALAQ